MVMRRLKVWVPAMFIALWAIACPPTILALDYVTYCNSVQSKNGFIRYPLGTVGAWSTGSGEIADAMTRVPRIYPCVDSIIAARAAKDDWRFSVTGDPSMLLVKYQTNKPSGATTIAITVSPHVSVFKVAFPEGPQKKYLVFDFSQGTVDSWARLNKWTNRTMTRIDDRTIQATVGEPGRTNAYYLLKFSAPCAGSGTIDAAGAITDGARAISGARLGMYARFEAPAVTFAVAESLTSMDKAKEFLAAEFTEFGAVQRRCHEAWNRVLKRVEIEGPSNSRRMAYTALYTIYANIIDGSDGSCYAQFCSHPRSVASSVYWQFIGGFQSCCWDNVRAAYPFLMLAYPEVMTDVVNTYLARYQRDGVTDGNICLFTGPVGEHRNIRFSPVLMAQAYNCGIQADYGKIYAALKDNFDNEACLPASLSKLGYLTQRVTGGKACSETLEFATGLHSLAVLAKANHDQEGLRRYLPLSKAYTNLWDSNNQVFRVKNPDGSWGVINNTNWTWNPNPQGLFEGTSRDWMFSVPHDPYGLIDLPGQEGFMDRVIGYCLNDTWFNDYQYIYPYLLYYAGAPNEAQKIIRTSWVPLFQQGIMYEGVRPRIPHNGWQDHYTSNAGWLLCSMLGLYPVPAPPGQFIISSLSITKVAIHNGRKDIILRAENNDETNIYVNSIKLDGKVYPSYMIPAKRLASGATIDLQMGSDPGRSLGSLYIGSSDGFVLEAELKSALRLTCVVEAAAGPATTKAYSRTKPLKVTVNGSADAPWAYDEAKRTLTIRTSGTARLEVISSKSNP